MRDIVQDAALDARDIIRDVVGDIGSTGMGDRALVMQYDRIRDNPQAIAQFTASHLPDATPDEVLAESKRYVDEMEQLRKGG